MASGNTLLVLTADNARPTASSAADKYAIAGASSPAEEILVVAFDSSSVEYCDFRLKMPQHYSGGGLTIVAETGGGSATGVYRFGFAIRRVNDDAEDLDTTAHTYDFNDTAADVAAPSAIGETTYDSVGFTTGADMDSLAAGESFILRMRRQLTVSPGTNMAADLYLHTLEIRET